MPNDQTLGDSGVKKKDFLLAGRDLQKDQALGGEAIRDRLGD